MTTNLTEAELERLSTGLPDLRCLGDQSLVEFEVVSLPDASVIWLNCGWFAKRGMRIQCDPDMRAQIESWILRKFAVTTPRPGFAVAEPRVAYADRYGDGSGTSPHGGSGRVATIGRFQVKGVGPTPLVGNATWMHSHGYMSITEAICEAVFGEVLSEELPNGAVPVIAIVDCGERFLADPNSGRKARRALVIRPAVLRPAHLLRAALFAPPPRSPLSRPGSDADRTNSALAYFATLRPSDRDKLNITGSLAELFERLAIQSATADVLRLYTGGLFAGNVAMDGALLDFGVARSMYTWAGMQLHAHAQGFGRDIDRLARTADAIAFYARKSGFSDAPFYRSRVDREFLQQTYTRTQHRLFGELWADEFLDAESQVQIRSATARYFELQQRIRLRERWDGRRPDVPWIHNSLMSGSSLAANVSTAECELLNTIQRVQRSATSRLAWSAKQCWYRSARILRPRPELDRRRFERRVNRLFETSGPPAGRNVSRYIDRVIGRSRRYWPTCPSELMIITQQVHSGSSALEVLDMNSGAECFWLEGVLMDYGLVWGNDELPPSALRGASINIAKRTWQCLCRYDAIPSSIRSCLSGTPHIKYSEPLS